MSVQSTTGSRGVRISGSNAGYTMFRGNVKGGNRVKRGEGSASRSGRSLPPGKDQVPIVQKVGWDPGSVWIGAENLASTGIRSPDRPARSQSLHRLSYPTHEDG